MALRQIPVTGKTEDYNHRKENRMNSLTIQLPDSVYEILIQRAAWFRLKPDQIAVQWIEEKAGESGADDPLLQLAGAFSSEKNDIGARHDEYIGKLLMGE